MLNTISGIKKENIQFKDIVLVRIDELKKMDNKNQFVICFINGDLSS